MELSHDRRGSGEPVVLLHGIGCRRQMFDRVIGPLAEELEVWSVDLPGFGASAPLPGGVPSIGALAEAVAGWMDEQGIAGAHVAGNSLGGGIALELADRGLAASACALAPIGFWSERERAFCQASVRATRAVGTMTRPLAGTIARNPLLRRLTLAQYMARPEVLSVDEVVDTLVGVISSPSYDDVRAAFTGYLAPATAADRVPVTIVWGGRDRLLLPRQLERARRRLPRARHVLLPTAGHLMMYDEPEQVAAVIAAATRAPQLAPVPA